MTNAPLGSAAGSEIMAAGDNAGEAAVALRLRLTVAEPIVVGIAGGGTSHNQLPGGRHAVVDALSCTGRDMHPRIFEPVTAQPPN